MESILFFKGFIIGLFITVPLGPIVFLCVQKTLNKGRKAGVIAGLGATTGDVFYAGITGFGIVVLANFLLEYQLIMRLIGSIMLVFLGIKTLAVREKINLPIMKENSYKGYLGDYMTTLIITLANPLTILFFPVLFTVVHPSVLAKTPQEVLVLLLGIFLGATIWWFVLTSVIHIVERKVIRYLYAINKITGFLLLLIGIVTIISTVLV